MARRPWTFFFLLGLSLSLCGGTSPVTAIPAGHPSPAPAQLTIYTYQSLMADPIYDYIGAYANYSGLAESDINVIALSDANSLITALVAEKDSPTADVVIGLDNILVFEAKAQGLLAPYSPPALANISSALVENLDAEHYLTPYDYGIIAFNYDRPRINTTTVSGLQNLTLQSLLDLNLDAKLVVEDPTLSSPGLGFLLSTIAIYGDPSLNFTGLLGGDWRDWWTSAASNLRIANSWDDAFGIFYEEDRPIMVSYGTSPAYTVCQGYGDDLQAFLTHEQGGPNAWLQIEGVGVVNGAPHVEAAQDFIDWFLSPALQDQIPEHNWMYPANQNATVSPCFAGAAIDPASVNILNALITPEMMATSLDGWKTEWEEAIGGAGASVPGYPALPLAVFMLCGMAWVGVLRFNLQTPHKHSSE